jgi:quinohemoprotein ethanol dehydrogenase
MPGRLLVFKLGGKATMPAYPKVEPRTIDLTGVTSTGDAARGKAAYHANCGVCHSPSAAGTYLPDLRTSPMILTAQDFKSVVLDGARKSRGMVSFSPYLTPSQAEDIRAYILTEARWAQTAGKPPKDGPPVLP